MPTNICMEAFSILVDLPFKNKESPFKNQTDNEIGVFGAYVECGLIGPWSFRHEERSDD
ncbi:hypothetical protein [Allomuricauda sp. SCSIO 65647]|uniref:hypothetical protein n=1 Tax=Allomuricauda sp. SCSIO 65647 TaxID=2908843 RepID=UPI001F1C14E8|nr:hypothetical protein [Muricauda sp. SCSIO 65647]UJH66447.1 hypothetical protein L0P89_10755 [Muricauda sp. SCSIO 65647]